MNEASIKVDGIAIVAGGRQRAPLDIARDFVQEQSMGEWGDDQVEEDAHRLARLLIEFAALPPTETPNA